MSYKRWKESLPVQQLVDREISMRLQMSVHFTQYKVKQLFADKKRRTNINFCGSDSIWEIAFKVFQEK